MKDEGGRMKEKPGFLFPISSFILPTSSLMTCIALSLCAAGAQGSVTLNGVVGSADFLAVGQFGTTSSSTINGSATAVFDGWYVLTARHLVTSDLTITGSVRPAAELRFRLNGTDYGCSSVLADFGADIALVKLNQTCGVSVSLYSAAAGSEAGQIFWAAGFGQTDTTGDGTWDAGTGGIRRSFRNTVDSITNGTLSGQGTVLRYDFDKTTGSPVGQDEGIHGPGDSGGGVFLWDDGEYRLAGVLSSGGSPVDQATASVTSLSPHAGAITAAVPEPTCLAVPMVAGMLSLRRRAKARVLK